MLPGITHIPLPEKWVLARNMSGNPTNQELARWLHTFLIDAGSCDELLDDYALGIGVIL
jgi:hypothetical protein